MICWHGIILRPRLHKSFQGSTFWESTLLRWLRRTKECISQWPTTESTLGNINCLVRSSCNYHIITLENFSSIFNLTVCTHNYIKHFENVNTIIFETRVALTINIQGYLIQCSNNVMIEICQNVEPKCICAEIYHALTFVEYARGGRFFTENSHAMAG